MADNLKTLKENLDQAINPNAGVGEILVQNHNNVFTEFINKSGKYTGSPFVSVKEATNGVVPTGVLVWNSNAMNNTDIFVITVSRKTLDLNNIDRILDTLTDGAIIHFKDFIGRSVHLEYLRHDIDTDTNNEVVFNITVKGFQENRNYTYQDNESEICIIEFYNKANESVPVEIKEVRIGQLWFFPPNQSDSQTITNGQEFRGFPTPSRYVAGIVLDATNFDIDQLSKANLLIDNSL